MREVKEVSESGDEVLQRSVGDLEISVRTYNSLHNAGITAIGQLVQRSPQELMKARCTAGIPIFGVRSIDEIKEALGLLNLELGMTLDD